MSRQALGKGLGALIPERRIPGEMKITLLPLESISPNPGQPRKRIAQESLAELVDSIRSQGVLQPILVKKSASGYELIAGERRWRAAALAGLREIPALVKEAGREESLAMALVENIQREDLNPIESGMAYQAMVDEFNLSQEEVARIIGKDRTSVANYIRLLKLPLVVQEDVSEMRLSMGHARALISLPDRKRQMLARDRILAKDLSVREAEELVKKLAREKGPAARSRKAADPHLASIEDELKRRLGTKVRISRKGRGGSIRILYHSTEELNRLLEQLLATE